MYNKTVELLSAKVADYGLPSSANSGKIFMTLCPFRRALFDSFITDLYLIPT